MGQRWKRLWRTGDSLGTWVGWAALGKAQWGVKAEHRQCLGGGGGAKRCPRRGYRPEGAKAWDTAPQEELYWGLGQGGPHQNAEDTWRLPGGDRFTWAWAGLPGLAFQAKEWKLTPKSGERGLADRGKRGLRVQSASRRKGSASCSDNHP